MTSAPSILLASLRVPPALEGLESVDTPYLPPRIYLKV